MPQLRPYGIDAAGKSSPDPITPIVRPAMQMRDRQYHDIAVVDGVNHSVREPAEAAAAHTLAQRMPRLRKASDAARGSQDLNQKRITKARSLPPYQWMA